MKPIAIWYHCRLSGGNPQINPDHACGIMAEQMHDLKRSGLADAANEIHIQTDGCHGDYVAACELAPANSICVAHQNLCSELPTIFNLRLWANEHPGWLVLYHHTKGAIHTGEKLYRVWRRCMQRHLVLSWGKCVADLGRVESVGCHWLTPEQHSSCVKSPFWGGNFWWARSEYLADLPEVKRTAENRSDFYDAESWIGIGKRRPTVIDYHPAWPGMICE